MMSNRLVEDVFKNSKAKGLGQFILVYMAYRADESGRFWASWKAMAAQMKINKDTLFKHIKTLEELGEIVRLPKQGKGGNNAYRVTRVLHSEKPEHSEKPDIPKVGNDSFRKAGTSHSEKPEPISTISPDKPLKKVNQKKEAHEEWIDDWFENQFWKPFPPRRKTDKRKCHTFIRNILQTQTGSKELAQEIEEGLRKWNASDDWTRELGEFTPMPYTWLNNRRWESPPSKTAKQNLHAPSTGPAGFI